MTISTSSIAIGTAISVTGGIATGLISKGDTLDLHNTVLDDGAAFKDHTNVDFSIKSPKVSASAPAGYTQARNVVVIKKPKTLANGNITYNSMRVELSCDSETTEAEKDSLRELAAQVIFDTDYDQFWNDQAMG
jgi:hypothetical protein